MEISMEYDEKCIVRLRDCFTGGYTLPQYCIDNGIKKPLFVSEKKHLQFMWEIYVQFCYDKRMCAQFCMIDMQSGSVNFSVNSILKALNYKNFSETNFDDFDAIILLTTNKININEKVISLYELMDYCFVKTYVLIPSLNFLQRYPNVKLFYTILPNDLKRYKGGVEFAQTLAWCGDIAKEIKKSNGEHIPTPLDEFGYTNQEFLILDNFESKIKTNLDGTTVMTDNDHPLVQIKNGKRRTAYQPETFINKIYFIGPCHFTGSWAPYDKTIESYLQKMLNDNNLPYCVENESQRFAHRYQDMFYKLNTLEPAPNDIIILWLTSNLHSKMLPVLDLSDAFDPPYNYKEFYCTDGHYHEVGYKRLAERFFEILTENNFFRDTDLKYPTLAQPYLHRYGIPLQLETGTSKSFINEDLEAYKKTLRTRKMPVGALVMNCNPFTLGHQYLVEYAAERVTKLYLFVVEEDRSEFPFADRIELVRQGVKHIPNVEVLPSGKFIISQQTFSGYFNKASLQDVAVDSSEDVEIFGKEIAPTLGITIRFAGEEPTDNVTRQYNETMKEILPHYGVEFCEIPRKEFGDKPISASIVCEALKRGDFDKIKNLVPDTTLLYLRGRYSMSK